VSDVFCNNCGHRNPLGSNFCSSCGAPLGQGGAEPSTITFQIDAPNTGEELSIDIDELPAGGALVVTRGPNAGSRFALGPTVTTAGRHPDSDVFLDDVTVSRRHAEIERVPGGHVVRDVGSLNGTYVNNERIETATLQPGDELRVGKFKLVYFEGTGPG
jgi:hypothetical protein